MLMGMLVLVPLARLVGMLVRVEVLVLVLMLAGRLTGPVLVLVRLQGFFFLFRVFMLSMRFILVHIYHNKL
jgi:hypothetical protein